MQVFVVGASGRVGRDLVEDLVAAGHRVVAGSRHPEAFSGQNHVTAVNFDLHASVDVMAKQFAGSQAVYFVAGSRGKDLLQTDAFGAVKTMQAAEKAGIRRYVMLSSVYTLQPREWYREPINQITDYNIAKYFADHYLVADSGLDYTIVQAMALVEEGKTGRIKVDHPEMGSVPIPDVALTLAMVLSHPNTVGKVIMVGRGQTPINDALASL